MSAETRRGPLSEWTARNPKLLPGEIISISDTNEMVVGDGTHAFTELPRFLNQTQVATTAANGFMSSTDKSKVDNIEVWQNGATTSRPASPALGTRYFDTTLGKPIWFNGTNWVDATGATV